MTDTAEPTVEPAAERPPALWPPRLVLLAGVAVLALALLDVPGTVRAVAVLTYLAVVPGLAWVRLIRPPDGVAQFVIGVALSLALGILVAEAMLQLRRWSPLLGLGTLVAVASLAALLELLRTKRMARRGGGQVTGS